MTRRGLNLISILVLTAPGPAQTKPKISRVGVGGTFPYPLYSRWITEYAKLYPGTDIRYLPAGSSEGMRQASNGMADFGATDAPMTDQELAGAKKKLVHLPAVIGAVVPIYNLPGVTQDLRFTAAALAGIYLGNILKWNDPGDRGVQSRCFAPGQEYRGSAPWRCPWHYAHLDRLFVQNQQGMEGPGWEEHFCQLAGRACVRKRQWWTARHRHADAYSIGYVKLTFAKQKNVRFGQVRNASGSFVGADLASLTAAAGADGDLRQFRVSLNKPSCEKCYPIVSYTWLLLPLEMPSDKRAVLKSFIGWALTNGQAFAEEMEYGPLPKRVVEKELIALSKL